MTQTSEENKTIAKTLVKVFGGKPSVNFWWDEPETTSVALLKCENAPEKGINSYATVNLSDHPLIMDGKEYPARVEIVGACAASAEEFPNVLTTCAFNIIKDKWFVAPGVIFPGVVDMYDLSDTLSHILFVPPFVWNDEPRTMEFPTKTVAFLQAVPISDAERDFANENGPDALESLFEEHQIDIYDINRASVV
jgi:antitoxin YqcF